MKPMYKYMITQPSGVAIINMNTKTLSLSSRANSPPVDAKHEMKRRSTHAYCGRPNHTGSEERHIGQLSSLSSHSATHDLWKMCE
jgi:hypothetical protein